MHTYANACVCVRVHNRSRDSNKCKSYAIMSPNEFNSLAISDEHVIDACVDHIITTPQTRSRHPHRLTDVNGFVGWCCDSKLGDSRRQIVFPYSYNLYSEQRVLTGRMHSVDQLILCQMFFCSYVFKIIRYNN